MKMGISAVVFFIVFMLTGCGATTSSQFPLPDSVDTFTEQGSADSVNFQTKLSLTEVVDFYKTALTEDGLVERTLLTVTEDNVISRVFDGHESGKSIIIQATKLPNDKVNVNIRLEKI